MNIGKNIKQIIRKCDLFYHAPTFRYNEEAEYKTVTGGLISFALILAFIGIFATTILNTIAKKEISFTLSRAAQQSPGYFASTLDRSFMFAVGLDNLDVNNGVRYFDISMQLRNYTGGKRYITKIDLIPCQKRSWETRGFGSKFDSLNLSRWLCPPQDTQINLQGKFTSDVFKFYKIAVNKCNSTLFPSRPCATNEEIQTFLNQNQIFNFNYYFINTIINPGDQEYLGTYLEDVNYFSFTPTTGIRANLFISSYNIDTDESLWPATDIHSDYGGIVLQNAQIMTYPARSTEYCKFYMRKSPIKLYITRSFKKIDQTFSYIGGLFSFLLLFLIFVKFYDEISYELQLIRSSYYFDQNKPFNQNFFNFLTFIPYMIFIAFDKIGVELPWPKYHKLHQFLQKGRRHLDIRLIMKKILLIQKMGVAILGQKEFQGLMLSDPISLDKAEQIRQFIKFQKRFVKQYPNNIAMKKQPPANQQPFASAKKIIRSFSQIRIKEQLNQDNLQIPKMHEDLGQKQNRPIKHKEKYNQQVVEVKQVLSYLQNKAIKDDVTKRIWQEINPRIKTKYYLSASRSSLSNLVEDIQSKET